MGPELHTFDISNPAANLKVLNGTVDISMATIMLISMHMGPQIPQAHLVGQRWPSNTNPSVGTKHEQRVEAGIAIINHYKLCF